MGAGLPVFCLAYLSKDKERDTVGGQPYSFDEKGAAVAAPFMVLFYYFASRSRSFLAR